jgi:hypothetical protein
LCAGRNKSSGTRKPIEARGPVAFIIISRGENSDLRIVAGAAVDTTQYRARRDHVTADCVLRDETAHVLLNDDNDGGKKTARKLNNAKYYSMQPFIAP